MSVYGPDLDLLRRLHVWLDPIGVRINEIAGWQTRGRAYATFDPYGSVNHHTAGGASGVAPSLGICINGRSDLPGPLCHVHQQRDPVVNLVAAGVANHAGPGSWLGLSGNQAVFGLEVEHIGSADEPFSHERWETSCRVHAAFLTGLGNPKSTLHCQHFEWSTQGKIDFFVGLLPGGAQGMRDRVAELLRVGPGTVPTPAPPAIRSDMVPTHCIDLKGRHWFFIVGTDSDVWASVNDSGFWPLVPRDPDNKPKTAFVSGLSALAFPDGHISVCGTGADLRGWQIVFRPDDPTPTWVGVIDSHPHAIHA